MSKPSEESSENLISRESVRPSLQLSQGFSLEQKRILLGVAHEAIFSALEGRPFSPAESFSVELSEPRGVFTTLYAHGKLRGCVGYALPITPLYRAVADTARAAAFEDARFTPVTKDEAIELKVSLSVLSRLVPIRPEAVEVGRHGLLIAEGGRRGLLLPQVPVERGWDRETFLDQTCRKAGLPQDAWSRNATIEAFTAEVFDDCEIEIRVSR
jgi:AmmeMemoRadiSam system protein A